MDLDAQPGRLADDPVTPLPAFPDSALTTPVTPTETVAAHEADAVTRAASPDDDARPDDPDAAAAPGPASIALMRAGKVLAGAALAGFAGLVWYIARIGVLPRWWLAGGAVVALAVVLAVALGLWRTKLPGQPYRYTVLTCLTALGLFGGWLVYLAAGDVRDALYQDFHRPASQTMTYDVLVRLDHSDDVQSIAGQPVGRLSTDPNQAAAAAQLAETVTPAWTDFDSLGTLADALVDGSVDALLVDHGYLAVYDDNRPEFTGEVKILFSFQLVLVAAPGPDPAEPTAANGAYIVYISGIDQYGSIGVTGRSDVNILAVVNPSTHHVLLVSTPRDYYVQLRGTTGLRDKLTHAGVYGIDVSVGTLEDLYGVTIDYYVRVNFDSVIRLVNLVGGVEVYSDRAFTARNGDTFTQGYNYMDGARALVFARERYAFAEGDRIRGQNQERVIEALIKKMSQPSQLAHFGAVFEAMQGGFETNMPGDQIAQVVSDQLKSGADWTIDRASVDGTGLMAPTYTYGSQDLYVMVPDEATVAAAHEQIAAVLAE